ncbi:endonuclease-3 [Breznakia sp. PF5-3]|uniref:endonuclease III n=1 Tax=unclassified Breznakia TaxID=2623764 RepID=UPI002407149E|nr:MULTISPECIES: endonuclease III [unclassified Breznakia]MDF9824084.1 endonuclease-3 [Breznakia sp. PM6-1]MDF9834850.1 endonuclease-3 [Breznakia sp. PF5-3]MDF9837128.1 endonuclease-3 [Breznakia sp. PFB2-8]MDF9859053.1 endonuclease-3 [Breznakia sp. PH5-24]
MDVKFILDTMESMFPDAECELVHKNDYELIIAVILSAQTTDQAVNKVTPNLFAQFPTPKALGEGDIKDIENCIRRIGLYRNKAANIKACAKALDETYDGKVPSSFSALTSLPGVGRKTANVVRSVWFDIPSMAVDTHVERISKRLGFAKFGDNVEVVETKLKRKIDRAYWNKAHHLFIFFGRYHCTARNPKCEQCAFVSFCKNKKFEAYKKSLAKTKK